VKTGHITVGSPPTAGFSANVTTGESPLVVAFKDSSTGSPSTWAWDIDNDGFVDYTTSSPVHEYSSPGTYTVNLTVTNDCGSDSEVKIDYITVYSGLGLPDVDFYANATTGYPPFVVQFTDTTVTDPLSWYWEFGDGEFSTDQNPLHWYNISVGDSGNSYTVSLNVTNATGYSVETKYSYITLYPLSVNFIGTPTSGSSPLTVDFSDLTSNGVPTAWSWNFGDGNYSSLQNPTHTYYGNGNTFTVTLNASNDYSWGISNKIDYITLKFVPTPTPTPTYPPQNGTVGLYQITSVSGESWIRWDWVIPPEFIGSDSKIRVLLDETEVYDMSLSNASEMSTTYTASGLKPNEKHTIRLVEYSDSDPNYLYQISSDSNETTTKYSGWYYMYFVIISIILTVIGLLVRSSPKSVVFLMSALVIELYLVVSTLSTMTIISWVSILLAVVTGFITIYILYDMYRRSTYLGGGY
jgi:PKD repeat protein